MYFKFLLVLFYYVYVQGNNTEECEPIPPTLTSPKTGQKAWDKCLEYQEKYVYRCEKNPLGRSTRINHCQRHEQNLILNDPEVSHHEFSHMALLGYDDEDIQHWQCSGSLISDKFILTVAHCTDSPAFGSVELAYIGTLDRYEVNPSKLYKIKRIVMHPDYKEPLGYNDIALLETDRPVELNRFTVPACLPVGKTDNEETAAVISYGLYNMPVIHSPSKLSKVVLTKFTREECLAIYDSILSMDEDKQLCFGERDSGYSCPTESGSPLQIENKNISCMHTVIGVTSFGSGCQNGKPIVYTQVSHYVPWIESIVWP